MRAVVIIDGQQIESEEVNRFNAIWTAQRLESKHNVPFLKANYVKADVYVEGVPSRMNDESFLVRPEAYDDHYFRENGS